MRVLAAIALCPVLLLGCKEGEPKDDAPPAPTSQAAVPAIEAPAIEAPLIALVALKDERVEVGCAKCSYDMPGVEKCMAAAMVNGHPVVVVGEGEQHAHAFCSGEKQAVITAAVEGDRLVASKMVVE